MKIRVVIFSLFLLILKIGNLYAQVHASFLADTNGVNTFYVIFTAQDTVVGYQYHWNFGDTAVDSGSVVKHQYLAAGNYRVRLVVTDPVTLASDTSWQRVAIHDQLIVPNIFTPNNDHFNDLFIIRSNGLDTYTLTVFTRSGVKVCKTTGKTITWNGRTPAGVYVSPGVYFYVLTSDKGLCRKGFLHVIR